MGKILRSERIALLLKVLTDQPGKMFTLGTFSEMFGSAKSTISEDVDILDRIMSKYGLGALETMPGASGGVRFVPVIPEGRIVQVLDELCGELSNKERILPGGFVYMLDIIYNPEKVSDIARIFVSRFASRNPDYVITVETKGIPLAFSTARLLNVPLVIVRRNSEATDGTSVSINYVSGSSRTIQTMVLPLKSLKRYSKVLFIDDFMKGGGTAKGISDLAREFECEVVGTGVLVETFEPQVKLVDNYISLLTLYEVDASRDFIDIKPSLKSV